MKLLMKLPRERWAERNEHSGTTLLHHACCGPNVGAAVALLQSGLVDVSARNKGGWTTTHMAAAWKQPRVLEVLCAAGADLRASDKDGCSPIDRAPVRPQKRQRGCACVRGQRGTVEHGARGLPLLHHA